MPNPTAAILIIGNEILSGRTRDANMHHLAGELSHIGIDLMEVRIVTDDEQAAKIVDLGEADKIDAAIQQVRKSMQAAMRKKGTINQQGEQEAGA